MRQTAEDTSGAVRCVVHVETGRVGIVAERAELAFRHGGRQRRPGIIELLSRAWTVLLLYRTCRSSRAPFRRRSKAGFPDSVFAFG